MLSTKSCFDSQLSQFKSSLLWATGKSSCAAQGTQQHQHSAWRLQTDQDTTVLWKQSWVEPHMKSRKDQRGNWLMQCYQVILEGYSEEGQCSANPHRSGSHRQGHRQVPRGERCTASPHHSKAFAPSMSSAFSDTQQPTACGPNL